MKRPSLQPSKYFYDNIGVECLRGKFRNSKILGVADRHTEEYEEDPEAELFLRGDSDRVTAWQEEHLGRLFDQDGLVAALREGMAEFENADNWCGYMEDGRGYAEIQEKGILPYLYVEFVVIDETANRVIIAASTVKDANLDEHGITVYLEDGKWRFDYADHTSEYLNELENDRNHR